MKRNKETKSISLEELVKDCLLIEDELPNPMSLPKLFVGLFSNTLLSALLFIFYVYNNNVKAC